MSTSRRREYEMMMTVMIVAQDYYPLNHHSLSFDCCPIAYSQLMARVKETENKRFPRKIRRQEKNSSFICFPGFPLSFNH